MIAVILALLVAQPIGRSRGPLADRTVTTYNILCLGDSITAGFAVTTPFSATLQSSIGASVAGAWNAGVPGDKSSGMLARWNSVLNSGSWDAVVVLGGVNDAIADVAAATIFANLQAVYDAAHVKNIKVIALTITPWKNYAAWTSGRQTIIDTVNTSIRNYVIANASNTVLVDTYALLGGADPQALAAANDSGDGIHPNQTAHTNVIAPPVKTALGF